MLLRRLTVMLSLLLVFSAPLFAQGNYVEMRVVVAFQDHTPLNQSANGMAGVNAQARDAAAAGTHPTGLASTMQIRIQVYNESGVTEAEGSPNSEGVATFRVLGSYASTKGTTYATYRVRVFGSEIEEYIAENVEPGRGDPILNVTIRKKGEKPIKASKGTVSAAGLKIPGKAQKELDKGTTALADGKLDVAKDHFQKAIESYPQFEVAYNNLGVVLMKQGDTAGGKQAFEKALSINDKYAGALVNLAKIKTQEKDYGAAMTMLKSSLSIEPLNPEALSNLCRTGIMAQQYQAVIDAAKTVHGVPQHEVDPICHYAAGLAYRNLHQTQEAIDEYILYVKEANTSSDLVAQARESIVELNKQAHTEH
jgi:tetratricopeptide (TPR) repeat protein